jgi:hypothetical protein
MYHLTLLSVATLLETLKACIRPTSRETSLALKSDATELFIIFQKFAYPVLETGAGHMGHRIRWGLY